MSPQNSYLNLIANSCYYSINEYSNNVLMKEDEGSCYPRSQAVFSLEIANQVVQRCKLPKVTLYVALYGLGQLLISLVAL